MEMTFLLTDSKKEEVSLFPILKKGLSITEFKSWVAEVS